MHLDLKHCIFITMATETLRGEPMRGLVEEPLGMNPYLLGEGSLKHSHTTPHGHFKVLERSKLLQGIKNYRLAILEVEPMTFVLPRHWDAELFYVMEGNGRISILLEEKRESYDISKGDLMRVPSGSIVYVINKDDKQKLRIVLLLHPVSIPGRFEEFFAAGGNDPRTFYTSLSSEVNEAAFNTSRESLEKIFGHQMKGVITKLSKQQIESIIHEQSSNNKSLWGPLNLLKQKPSHSNDYGQVYKAKANSYLNLRNMDVYVSLLNISSGSLMVPHSNLKATKLAIVVEGGGFIEIICPRQEGGDARKMTNLRGHDQYKRLRLEVCTGSVFVILACHLMAVVSTGAENLQILCFGINAESIMKCFLAGRNNVLNQMEKVAKELAFGSGAKAVEEVLGAQKGSAVVPGPPAKRPCPLS